MVNESYPRRASDPIAAERTIKKIANWFNARGDRMYGEAVTERSHALQCAEAAQKRGGSKPLIIACLLHDIGHLMHDRGEDVAEQGVDMRHEVIAEKYLRKSFPESVSRPVGLHVDAKRFLCTVESKYFDGLSYASKLSLELQGGLMTEEECSAFMAEPFCNDAILVRRCDEEAKQTDTAPPALETYFPIMRDVIVEAGGQPV